MSMTNNSFATSNILLFQSCILNFNEKMMAFYKIDMTEVIPQNFLTLSVSLKVLINT